MFYTDRLKRRHTAPAFHTIFLLSLWPAQKSAWISILSNRFQPYNLLCEAKDQTCYCQQQSSQYPIFPSQARDQSFTRVARHETKYQKILNVADFARRENCSFTRLNDAFRKNLLKAAKKTLRQPTMRAEFSLIGALISNWHTEKVWEVMKNILFWGRGGGNKLIASEKLHQSLSTVAYSVPIK